MSILLHGDCLELMKDLDDASVDLIFCDLPYNQTSCKWDIKIDMDKFWIEVMRIKKINTPLFFTTTTKFGVDLITSAPKKCPFRYDLVWVKSAPAGFLSAKKMPMRKHEMIYVFYEKLPFYDLSSHKHKFIDQSTNKNKLNDGIIYNSGKAMKVISDGKGKQYTPPLPVSVVKQEKQIIKGENNTYNTEGRKKPIVREKAGKYETPLPVSVVKEEKTQISKPQEKDLYGASNGGTIGNVHGTNYQPPLPVSVVKEIDEKYKNKGGLYSKVSRNGLVKNEPHYEPPLPVSVVKQEKMPKSMYGELPTTDSYAESVGIQKADKHKVHYNPPLPNSMLEIKSTRGKHSTEKPVALMEWILKYYSKEGDVVLDPTMGSGSTGVACKNMNRNFIGMEMNDEIYEVACNRIYD